MVVFNSKTLDETPGRIGESGREQESMNQKRTTSESDKGNPKTLSRSAQRRERERTQRLETILRAAEHFFTTEGYHKSSMEKIADEAEVSVGTLYFYFKNKEDLLMKLLDTIGFEIREILGQAFRARPRDSSGDGFDGLRRASRAFFTDFCRNHPEKLTIIFRESVGQSEVVEEKRKKIFSRLIGDLIDAAKNIARTTGCSFRSEESLDIVAAGILGTYERLAYRYLIWSSDPVDLEAIANEAVDFAIGGVEALLTSEARD